MSVNQPPISRAEARRRIFTSVFPPSSSASTPTPISSPRASFPQPTVGGHGYNTRHNSQPLTLQDAHASVHLTDPGAAMAWESRAWHLATSFLSFPDEEFPDQLEEWIDLKGSPSRDAIEAIRYLVSSNDDVNVDGKRNLMDWYTCEVRRHFLQWVAPLADVPRNLRWEGSVEFLESVLSNLTTAQDIYVYQFKTYLLFTPGDASPRRNPKRRSKRETELAAAEGEDPRTRAFLQVLNSMTSYSLKDPGWSDLVYEVFLQMFGSSVGIRFEMSAEDMEFLSIDGDGDEVLADDLEGADGLRAQLRSKALRMWGAMDKIGIGGGGRRGERVFAEIINTIITAYINQEFAGRWESPSTTMQELGHWVEHVLGGLIIDILFSMAGDEAGDGMLGRLSLRESMRASRESLGKRRKAGMDVDYGQIAGEEERKRRREDLETWKKIAMGRLGRLRVGELFDIVVEWPQSLGGVEDLKSYITTPQTRLHLTTTFAAELSSRILHPAAATTDVLTAYIRLIRAFTVLDPRGVLLDRVSRSIRRYLRDRDDTVKMIVRGIMSETLRVPLSPDEQDLTELSEELSNGLPRATALGGLEELDFDDMNWVPDPVDAGPEFRRSKGLDVVGSLISLWENKEVWIKEIQGVLADRLLQDPKYDFKKEMHTVELLKLRFGETATQCLDVMLKDIRDSKRCDAVILELRPISQQDGPEFHAKILSRFYWPPPREKNVLIEHFKLPAVLAQLMKIYQIGFETLKKKRKLEWIITAGVCAVELELEDRIVSVPDATPAQAAVIYAFQDNTQNYHVDGPKSLTVEELQKQTLMREALLNKCLLFWVEKGVLVESSPSVYTVLEFAGSRAGSPVGRPPVVPIQDLAQLDEEKENEKKVVEQFVVGMLTNGGIMPTERIFMMLGMLVPGGFRWSTEELGEFLNGMKERGKVEPVAGGWKVVT